RVPVEYDHVVLGRGELVYRDRHAVPVRVELDALVEIVADARPVREQVLDRHLVVDERKVATENRAGGGRELEQPVFDQAHDANDCNPPRAWLRRADGWRASGSAELRPQRQIERRTRGLREVEVAPEVAEDLRALPHVGPWVGPAVGRRVDALPVEEVVLNELQIRIEAQNLMVDVSALRVRADHEPRHAQAVAVRVDLRWPDV